MAEAKHFRDGKLYRTDDPALSVIGTKASLNQLRYLGKGPAWTKLGNKILYSGKDLNDYIQKHGERVEPRNDYNE